MKLRLILFISFFVTLDGYSQNVLKTIEIEGISAEGTQAKRYEIVRVGYNSHHWQVGGAIIVELFHKSYSTGYEKFSIEYGYHQGTTATSPEVRHLESYGGMHTARVSLGDTIGLGTSYGGKPNIGLPIYVDARFYAKYNVRVSFMQEIVDSLTSYNQIQINGNSIVSDIPDFVTSVAPFNISSNGNVGIQTTNPQRGLHIGSTLLGPYSDTLADIISSEGMIIGRGKSLSLDQSYKTHAFIEYSPRISSEARFIHQGYYGHIFSVRNNVPAFSIMGNNGNVGIGTYTPQSTFHIAMSKAGTYQLATSYKDVIIESSTHSGISIVSPDNYTSGIRFNTPSSGQYGFGGIAANFTSKNVNIYTNDINGNITFSAGGSSEKMRILSNGNVGIGTTTIPNDFKLVVEGKILAEKVVIRKKSNWNFPDFVFEEDYELPSLDYISSYVKKYKHLPLIPSAKEVDREGMDLAEMNRLLLQKVEELTLYLVQQDKRIKKLEISNKKISILD